MDNSSDNLGLIKRTEDYIAASWVDTIRFMPADKDDYIGLPYPYTVPCRKDTFQELYYWDTYFINLGLVGSGRADLAEGNIRNFLAEIDRFGFIPNGNRTYFLSASQPPYLCAMVRHLYTATKNEGLLRDAIPRLQKEYEFWTTRRSTGTGLSRHWHHGDAYRLNEYKVVAHRVPIETDSEAVLMEYVAQCMAEGETGWDFTPRFGGRCGDFCPVDLNSNLYLYEQTLGEFSQGAEQAVWNERAKLRVQRINELCWDDAAGVYSDYNYIRNEKSNRVTAATFHPLWTGLASEEQAAKVVKNALPLLEYPFGVVACVSPREDSHWQWAAPNAWACLQNITYRGLARYGYLQEARRIAAKYITVVAFNFQKTGDLWEKYNAADGSLWTTNERGYSASDTGCPPALLGWTAGVYLDALQFLTETGDLSVCGEFLDTLH